MGFLSLGRKRLRSRGVLACADEQDHAYRRRFVALTSVQ
jgi:hypothetical protein